MVSRTYGELRTQMIAAIALWQPRDASANRFEPRRQLSAAPIDRRLVVGRGLDSHQRFDRVDEPARVGPAKLLKVV